MASNRGPWWVRHGASKHELGGKARWHSYHHAKLGDAIKAADVFRDWGIPCLVMDRHGRIVYPKRGALTLETYGNVAAHNARIEREREGRGK